MKTVLYLPLHHDKDSVYKYMAIGCRDKCGGYKTSVTYYSKRYDKYVTVQSPYRSDGATSALDIDSDAWWFHDVLCDRGTWDDGTPLGNWQCSTVLYDVMRRDDFSLVRSTIWRHQTFLWGGGKARLNGMFSVRKS